MRQLLPIIVDDAHVQEHVRAPLLRLEVELLLPSERAHACLQPYSTKPVTFAVVSQSRERSGQPNASWLRTLGPEREPIGLVSVMPHRCNTVMPNLEQ